MTNEVPKKLASTEERIAWLESTIQRHLALIQQGDITLADGTSRENYVMKLIAKLDEYNKQELA